MASNFFKVDKGVTLAPQSSIASPQNGDVYYDSTRNTYVFRNNGASVDLQSRSDVGTASSLTSANFTSTVIQSNLIKLTGSTVSNIHGITASSDAKMIVLYNGSSAVVTIKNASGTEATAGNRILTSTGADVNLNAGEAVQLTYDSTQARWIVVSTPGGSANGGTEKNYLTTYKNNPGNGNFESASTTGWSLGTTGTLTNGLPTGSPTFGSGASGNLSISTVSSGQLAGSYSLSYASSAATTQGNMLASDAFSIDLEDQAKVLQWKFYYKAQTNPSNADWSGTSSNSFGVAIYDVTNSKWADSVTGNFAMTQSSGVGIATGTVQTASNTTQLRLVVYNVNATSGAVTVYFDDFSVSPQTASIGSVVTDWQSFTPTGAWSTNTSYVGVWRRVGDSMEVEATVTCSGAPTTATFTLNLPGGYSIDTAKISSTNTRVFGVATAADSGVNNYSGSVWYNNSTSVQVVVQNASSTYAIDQLASNTVPFTFGAADYIKLSFRVPITGWSSNVQMSSDTDTRVVAFSANRNGSNQTGLAPNNSIVQITMTGTTATAGGLGYDTHGTFNSSGYYDVPVTGTYRYIANILINGTNSLANQYRLVILSGSTFGVATASAYSVAVVPLGNSAGNPIPIAMSGEITVTAGTRLWLGLFGAGNNSASTLTMDGTIVNSNWSMSRLSGPSVIAASESVNMRYTNNAGTVVGTSFAVVPFANKIYDSHNAYNTATGIYTVPVSGKYRVSCTIQTALVNLSTTQGAAITIYKNGAEYGYLSSIPGTGAAAPKTPSGSDTVDCVAGDTISVYALSDVATTLSTTAVRNHISIERVGN